MLFKLINARIRVEVNDWPERGKFVKMSKKEKKKEEETFYGFG